MARAVQIAAEAERRRRPFCVPVDGRTNNPPRRGGDPPEESAGHRRRRRAAPQAPTGHRKSSPDWLAGSAALRRVTACSGVASRSRPGVDGKLDADRGWTVFQIPSTPWVPSSRSIGPVRSGSGGVRTRRHSVVVLGHLFGRRGSWVRGETAERRGGGAQARWQMAGDRRRRGGGARAGASRRTEWFEAPRACRRSRW